MGRNNLLIFFKFLFEYQTLSLDLRIQFSSVKPAPRKREKKVSTSQHEDYGPADQTPTLGCGNQLPMIPMVVANVAVEVPPMTKIVISFNHFSMEFGAHNYLVPNNIMSSKLHLEVVE